MVSEIYLNFDGYTEYFDFHGIVVSCNQPRTQALPFFPFSSFLVEKKGEGLGTRLG